MSDNFSIESVPPERPYPNKPASAFETGTIVRLNTGERFRVADSQRDGKYWERIQDELLSSRFPVPQRDT
ncbi:hypothetical protein SEA_LESNORAH_21 [Microbacterium phage LesNorah]|nr:hypothetical protein SEA_BLUERUGRAT_21 [Microbacterium phage BlueRugrat]UQS94787.1 hypothetical protein SEA_LESNORAH_21 [Microbacterium phage LesNorah]